MQNKVLFLFLLLLLLGIPNANALEVIHWSIFDATNPQTAISCKKLNPWAATSCYQTAGPWITAIGSTRNGDYSKT